MAKFNKVSADAFKNIQKGAGNVLSKFDITGKTTIADEDIICATTGGVNATCVPSYVDYGEDIDNVPTNTLELKEIDSWEAKMSFTALDCTDDVFKLSLGAADVTTDSTTSVQTIKPRATLKTSDFKDVWWVGPTKGDGWCAIKLSNALSTGGLSIQSTDDGKGNLAVELTGHFSIDDTDTVPMEFYVSAGTSE